MNKRVTRSWMKWRIRVYNRDGRRCILCGRRNKRMAPHHILPKRDFPKLRYYVCNGVTLCWKDHKKTFGREYQYVKKIVKILFGGMNRWRLTKHYNKLKMPKKGKRNDRRIYTGTTNATYYN